MDSTEVHYLTYDPDEVWKAMTTAYIEAGGKALYPGDEKEMLLRGVQAILIQAFAGVDQALRMDTLRYAAGDYLDIYGEKRGCVRIQAQAAETQVRISFKASGTQKTIAAGTALTADGEQIYLLESDVSQSGLEEEILADVVCQKTGSTGNGLTKGTQMQFMIPNPAVLSVYVEESASGGQDKEKDTVYRERIREYGLSTVTTGPSAQYESAAMAVTSEIVDAKALNIGDGKVGVYLILSEDATGEEAIIESVKEALNAKDVRPLTDTVTVEKAKEKAYTLNVQYAQEAGSNLASAMAAAAQEYQDWQDNEIGQPFNPDKLMAMLYQAGATRVIWGDGSAFDGGTVQYTAVDADTRCKGTITLSVIAQ